MLRTNGMKVEILYFDGCPGFAEFVPRVRDLVGSRGEVELHSVESVEDAQHMKFLGSPTLRVNGEDVEPGADGRTDFGMKCRLYRAADRLTHAPPDDWVRRALDAAA